MRSIEHRLAARVDKSGGPDACWPWTGACLTFGYGQIWDYRVKRPIPTHRAAFELHSGAPIPTGLQVLHRCDNPPCCNPRHLFLGTQRDNMHDMLGKGRGRAAGPRGPDNGLAKLTEDQVREMREIYRTTMTRQVDLAKRFGVCQSVVSAILRRATWSHI